MHITVMKIVTLEQVLEGGNRLIDEATVRDFARSWNTVPQILIESGRFHENEVDELFGEDRCAHIKQLAAFETH